ncbi:exonuclease [Muribacter muris]|uniref:Exonuclease n=1 Tax=Muribacter muris TaxID=67855 RepID=A0A4Y9JQU8_9PAST|nr:lambda exonuclease family protein [Muribacter muris]MBF0786168.1 YqaJ viral recombinase family protein [Muribacter muris]MBF0828301.1 YqaJ viral recombinase family protein [Muribacter muris]TFV07692.1 exonuclease [Muribacter muris]
MAILQGSAEWFEQRRGKVTASRIADLMAKTKSGYAASRQNYLMQLLCERFTGKVEESYKSDAMKRGNELEPEARNWYQIETGEVVEQVGFIDHPYIDFAGASPDGLVGNDGLIEIKCPNTATHIETLRTKQPSDRYYKQMQWQMAVTGRKWCDFVSFDNRLPDNLAFFCTRIARNGSVIAEIEAEVTAFLTELEVLQTELNATSQAK